MAKKKSGRAVVRASGAAYRGLLSRIALLLEHGRHASVRAVNVILTATYWETGRQIVEFEQHGMSRAEYGEHLMRRLSVDLSARFGRGFSQRNVEMMRLFYLSWQLVPSSTGKLQARVKWPAVADDRSGQKAQTVSALSASGRKAQTVSALSASGQEAQISSVKTQSLLESTISLTEAFPLPWSHYVRLMSVSDDGARWFYEDEAIRGGWSVRQLDRQISTQFFEGTVRTRTKDAKAFKSKKPRPENIVTLEESVRDPYLLEFLDLKDEYSESELEDAIVRQLELFLLELGSGFTFVARQKRLRVGNEWYRVDLLLYHRRLRCLVVIDLKLGKFTHADAGQMNLYLNYAREHWMEPGENKPIGLILCSAKDDAVAHYAMGGIQAQVFATRYLTHLPSPESLRQEVLRTQHAIRTQTAANGKLRYRSTQQRDR